MAKAQLLDWSREPHWAIEFNGAVVGGIALRISVEHAHAELTYELARALERRPDHGGRTRSDRRGL